MNSPALVIHHVNEKKPDENRKTGKSGKEESDIKLNIVLGSARILAILFIVAIVLTPFNEIIMISLKKAVPLSCRKTADAEPVPVVSRFKDECRLPVPDQSLTSIRIGQGHPGFTNPHESKKI
jgi:hypothetical protein